MKQNNIVLREVIKTFFKGDQSDREKLKKKKKRKEWIVFVIPI